LLRGGGLRDGVTALSDSELSIEAVNDLLLGLGFEQPSAVKSEV